MNQLKQLLSYGCLLMASHYLYASKGLILPKEEAIADLAINKRKLLIYGYVRRVCYTPHALHKLIEWFLYGNPLQYKGKQLPANLSGYNLRGFDFTGCNFMNTKLYGTMLEGAILENTTCDYRTTAKVNIPKVGAIRIGDHFYAYRDKLTIAFESMYDIYPSLNNEQKATLLQVASGFSWLPFLKEKQLYCRYAYYASKLLDLKIQEPVKCAQLDLPLASIFEYIGKCCWSSGYRKNEEILKKKVLHSNFEAYVKEFEDGLIQYNCKSDSFEVLGKYKKMIKEYLGGLKNLYPLIKHRKKVAEKVLIIAQALASSYQYGRMRLFGHLNFWREHLLELKDELAGSEAAKCICL